jgi:hypothetical protein
MKIIPKIQVEKIQSVRPKALATAQFIRHVKVFLKLIAWPGPSDPAHLGFRLQRLMNFPIHPGSTTSFARLLKNPRHVDDAYVCEEKEDMFRCRENGLCVCEKD